MKIQTKLTIYAIIAIVAALVLGFAIFLIAQNLYSTGLKVNIAISISQSATELNTLTYDYLISPEERSKEQWNWVHTSVGQKLVTKEFKESSGQDVLKKMKKSLENMQVAFVELVRLQSDPPKNEATLSAQLKGRLANQLLVHSREIVSDSFQLVNLNRAHVKEVEKRAALIVAIFVVVLLALMIGIIVLTNTSIAKPLLQLTAQLEEDKTKDEAILVSIGDGLVVTDQNGRVTKVNERTEKILGWKAKELIGKKWSDVIEMQDKNGHPIPMTKRPVYLALTRAKMTTTTTTTTTTYVRKNKTKFPVALSIKPVFLDGHIIGTVAVFRDITQEEKMQKMEKAQLKHETELESKEREFLSVASHQLLTPLALIEGYLSMIVSGKYGQVNSEIKDYLSESLGGAERMSKLVKTLLTTSRLESGSIMLTKLKFDLGALVTEVAGELKSRADQKKLKLSLHMAEDLTVLADSDHTREVMSNLLDNAIKYTESGTITITGKHDGETVLVSIKDTGLGISQKNLPHIFEKFYLSENWIKKQSQSNGLGLYISRLLIELMGGKIAVESVVGKGSIFTVVLPST